MTAAGEAAGGDSPVGLDLALASGRHRTGLGRPYCQQASAGPNALDALKAQYRGIYEVGEDEDRGLYFAIPLNHGSPTLWGLTPLRLAEWIRADLASTR